MSFLVTVYNKAPYLPALVANLRAQTGDFPREFIFVDDGSTDGSVELLRDLTVSLPRTTIVVQQNAGAAAATNRGLGLASLPFTKLMDADDLIQHDCTRRMLAALAPSRAGLAWCGRTIFRPGETPDTTRSLPCSAPILHADPLPNALRNTLFNPTQALLRTDLARDVGGCDERYIQCHEYGLSLRMANRAPFLQLPEELALYCQGVPGCLSADKPVELARVTHGVGFFLADNPDLPKPLVRFAMRRAARRALRFTRRHNGAGRLLPAALRALRAPLPGPLPSDPAAFVHGCAALIATVPLRSAAPA